MAEQFLLEGGVYKFRRENSNLVCTDASDFSQAQTIFNHNVKITGSANSGPATFDVYGDTKFRAYDAGPTITIESTLATGDPCIYFDGSDACRWTIGVEDGVDKFRIRNGIGIGYTSTALTINSSDNVGIGDDSPSYKLDVNGTFRATGTIYANNGAYIPSGYQLNFTGYASSANEDAIKIGIDGEKAAWIKWYDDDAESTQATWIGMDAGTNKFHINVRENSNDAWYNFKKDGTLELTNVVESSDKRLKTNIKPLNNSLQKVLSLNGVYYTWISDAESKNQIGFIAQEVEEVIPEVVETDTALVNGGSNLLENKKSVSYSKIVPVLVEAIKELTTKVEALEKRLGDK